MEFVEGKYEVTSCYYEFAYRYPMADGTLFSGFVADSADKIFESTNMKVSKEAFFCVIRYIWLKQKTKQRETHFLFYSIC